MGATGRFMTTKRKRWLLGKFPIRGMLLFTAVIALVIGCVAMPLESRRRAVNELKARGIEVVLHDDPTDPFPSFVYGHEFEEPDLLTTFVHKTFPTAYVRGVSEVTIGEDDAITEKDFKLIARLGSFSYLNLRREIPDPIC